MDHLTSFKLSCNGQSQTSFFETLPGEIRDRIFAHNLSCFDDKTQIWDKNSSWVRPGYDAPQKADTALLRTCQRVYTEAWFRPWLSTTHSFWLAWAGRRPDDRQRHTPGTFQPALTQLFDLHGKVELDHVRVFAQLCSLESGSDLAEILDLSHFYPKVFTVTVRHHDWWSWESDNPLAIGSSWVDCCSFPSSITQLRIELESLHRKKNQIDFVAGEIAKKWQFALKDGTVLTARPKDCETATWSGSSTWEGERWIRDETKPETNEYYVKTVVFKPNKDIPCKDRIDAEPVWCSEDMFQKINCSRPYLTDQSMDAAGVQSGMTADEAKKLVDAYHEQRGYDTDDYEYNDEDSQTGIGGEDDDEVENEEDDEEDGHESDEHSRSIAEGSPRLSLDVVPPPPPPNVSSTTPNNTR